MPSTERTSPQESALFVDLDGTLTSSDLLAEALVLALKRSPLGVFSVLRGGLRGRARLKRELALRVCPDVTCLPYRAVVLDFLAAERANDGRRIVLATASDLLWAERVAQEVGLFDDVIASEGEVNLKGPAKLEAIRSYCERHGIDRFDYLGDSSADIPIWQSAERALAVGPGHQGVQVLEPDALPRFSSGGSLRPGTILKAMRPQQWVKNLLLFAPLVLAHQLTDLPRLVSAVLAFFAFSLCASAIYILNDVLDAESDRRHPSKKRRPFASGQLPLFVAPPVVAVLGSAGLGIALLWLPPDFQLALVAYVVLTTAYSLWLKSKVMVDVVLLALLYTLRILAGGMATDTAVSEWMMSFSLFIFTSLAFAKRYSELRRLGDAGETSGPAGRGYRADDLEMLASVGPASGYLSVLVLVLYLNSEQVRAIYGTPLVLWGTCPLMLYWIGHLWIVAGRGELPDDPVAYTVTDWRSWIVAACAGLILLLAV